MSKYLFLCIDYKSTIVYSGYLRGVVAFTSSKTAHLAITFHKFSVSFAGFGKCDPQCSGAHETFILGLLPAPILQDLEEKDSQSANMACFEQRALHIVYLKEIAIYKELLSCSIHCKQFASICIHQDDKHDKPLPCNHH